MSDELNIQQYRDAVTRLRPLQKLLSDLALACEQALQADQAQRETTVSLASLQAEVAKLQEHAEQLRRDRDQAERQCVVETETYNCILREVVSDHQAQRDELDQELAEYKTTLQAERSQLEAAHAERLAEMAASEARAAETLAGFREALVTLQARVRGV